MYNFLLDISRNDGYKLFSENRNDFLFETVIIFSNKIYLQFYGNGGISYKTINGLSKKIELKKCKKYDGFSVIKDE